MCLHADADGDGPTSDTSSNSNGSLSREWFTHAQVLLAGADGSSGSNRKELHACESWNDYTHDPLQFADGNGGNGGPSREELRALVQAEINKALAGRPARERITAFELVEEEFRWAEKTFCPAQLQLIWLHQCWSASPPLSCAGGVQVVFSATFKCRALLNLGLFDRKKN
jgi:hypothetical protein